MTLGCSKYDRMEYFSFCSSSTTHKVTINLLMSTNEQSKKKKKCFFVRSFGALRNQIVCFLLLRMLQSDGEHKYICTVWCVLYYSNPVLLIRFRKAIIEFKSREKKYKKCNERMNFASSHLNSESECVLRDVFHLFLLIKVGVTSTIIFISHFKTEKTKISFNFDFDIRFRMLKIHK